MCIFDVLKKSRIATTNCFPSHLLYLHFISNIGDESQQNMFLDFEISLMFHYSI